MPDRAWSVGGWIWLGFLFVAGVILVTREIMEPGPPVIDTQVTSGVHLTFVVVAPTGLPSPEYVDAVKAARTAYKRASTEAGCHFSTVGISQQWYLDEGLDALRRFGHFDEVIVGRGWFNSGLQRYVTDLESIVRIPQVAAVLEEIEVKETWWKSTGSQEVARHFGESGLVAWQREGSPIAIDARLCNKNNLEESP